MDRTTPGKGELAGVVADVLGLQAGSAYRTADKLIASYKAMNPLRADVDVEQLTRDDHADILAGLVAMQEPANFDVLEQWMGDDPWSRNLLAELRNPNRMFGINAQIEALFVATPPDVTSLYTLAHALLMVFVTVYPSQTHRIDVNGEGMARILCAAIAQRPAW